jgi:aspartate/methionine/tyrosine aminotransferase
MSKPANFETLRMGISVMVPIPLREKLRMAAAAQGIPMARLVQALIEEAIEARVEAELKSQPEG